MTDEKQSLSPAEWKSIGDYLIQLSEKVQQASQATGQTSEIRRDGPAYVPPRDR